MATNMTMGENDSGLLAALDRLLGVLTLLVALALAPHAQATEKVAVCYASVPSALVPLAKQRGFYAAEGLDVELRRYPSGRQALEAMFAGQCALATTGEIPLVHSSLRRGDLRIVAAIATYSDLDRIIVRSDRGILAPADLRGRRIALAEFTGAHYFLDMFLAARGVASQEVKRVYLPAQEVAPAFRRGEVDAAAHWEPNLQAVAVEFGSRVKTFTAPGLHTSPFLLVGGRDYVRQNPAAVERILRALLRSERFAREQAAAARALMAPGYDVAQSDIDLMWPLHDFRVTLDQSLPFILENAARWEIGLLAPGQRPALPNYLDFIHLDGLRAVKPAAVTIIH